MRFSEEEEVNILRTVAGVLHLGNILFLPASDNSDGCVVDPSCSTIVDDVCRLLGLDRDAFERTLRYRLIQVGTEITAKPQRQGEVSQSGVCNA